MNENQLPKTYSNHSTSNITQNGKKKKKKKKKKENGVTDT